MTCSAMSRELSRSSSVVRLIWLRPSTSAGARLAAIGGVTISRVSA